VGEIAKENLERFKSRTDLPIVPVSAKEFKNINTLTNVMREMVSRDVEMNDLKA
jgi:GTPase Era involved in 16S rRNA processing